MAGLFFASESRPNLQALAESDSRTVNAAGRGVVPFDRGSEWAAGPFWAEIGKRGQYRAVGIGPFPKPMIPFESGGEPPFGFDTQVCRA